ncbi:hypothetical protein AVEN_6529-1 [Araneus ventricosus]|uniref:Uncharacterized protein n=1 Tax=Araneus ventricosus TaxID=182803 RepID=A0A4Y2E6N7_ARAVE|nr:hypothetical protein AVEN_6529-1 [Araneus ventricosus]
MQKTTSTAEFKTFGLIKFKRFSLVTLTSRVLKQHDDYFGTDLVIVSHGQMTRTTPELAPSSPNFRTSPGPLRMIWSADGPHTRRIFGGIVFRAWDPQTPKPIPYH